MVMLHDALKTIQNGVFVFCLKKKKNLFLFKKAKKFGLKKQKTGGLLF